MGDSGRGVEGEGEVARGTGRNRSVLWPKREFKRLFDRPARKGVFTKKTAMPVSDDGENAVRRNQFRRSMGGVLEHGACPVKGAVLLGTIISEPAPNQRSHSQAFSPGE